MLKPQVLLCFTLFSAASACPIKPGFVANGQVTDNLRLVPVCGTIPNELKVLPEGTTWLETFAFSPSANNNIKLLTLKAALRTKGYTQFNEGKNGKDEIYQFAKGDRYVVLSTLSYKGARFLRIAGN